MASYVSVNNQESLDLQQKVNASTQKINEYMAEAMTRIMGTDTWIGRDRDAYVDKFKQVESVSNGVCESVKNLAAEIVAETDKLVAADQRGRDQISNSFNV